MSLLLLLEPNGDISAAIDDLLKLGDDQVQLSYEFVGFGQLFKFDGLDQSLLEAVGEVVRGIELKHGVADSNQVFYVAVGQIRLSLQECVYFPLRHIGGEFRLILCSC